MKVILLFIWGFIFKSTTGQIKLSATTSEPKTIVMPLIKKVPFNTPVKSIASYVRDDINRKLFANSFYHQLQKEQAIAKLESAGFIRQRILFFDKANFNKALQYKPGNATLDNVTMIIGSALDMFLQQYSIQNSISH